MQHKINIYFGSFSGRRSSFFQELGLQLKQYCTSTKSRAKDKAQLPQRSGNGEGLRRGCSAPAGTETTSLLPEPA